MNTDEYRHARLTRLMIRVHLCSPVVSISPCQPSIRVWPSRFFRCGSAEIELLIVCIILLSLILLVAGTLKIGGARLASGQEASFQAFHDATDRSAPLYTNNPAAQPIDGIATIRPTLPNRTHAPQTSAQVTGLTGGDGNTFTASVGSQAAAISPTWAYSAYPVGASDQAMLQTWFEDYVRDQGIDDNTRWSLGLSASWQP